MGYGTGDGWAVLYAGMGPYGVHFVFGSCSVAYLGILRCRLILGNMGTGTPLPERNVGRRAG